MKTYNGFRNFIQRMSNRIEQGECRYGEANENARYLSRLKKELIVYEKTGNFEQLLNIANYCFLESIAPQNKKFHFDNTIGSVTRRV